MGWSGGAQQTLWMARALLDRGHALQLVCQPGSEIAVRAIQAGIPILELRMRQDYDLLAVAGLVRILRHQQTEVLHAQHSTAHAIGLMAAAWTDTPVFAVTRRVTFRVRRNPFSRLKYLSHRVDGYVAISQAVRQELLQAGVPSQRVAVVPSVVELGPTDSNDRLAFRTEIAAGNAPVIGVIGNYAEFKGQNVMVRAIPDILKRHPDALFVFAGRGVEALGPLLKNLGVEKSARILGFRTDVPKILAGLDIYVMPSLEEAAGTALREAMLAGLPCVGSRVGGIPESIEDGVTGLLVPAGDPRAISQAVDRLLIDRESSRRMGEAGRRFCAEHFSISAGATRMESLYQQWRTKTKSSAEAES